MADKPANTAGTNIVGFIVLFAIVALCWWGLSSCYHAVFPDPDPSDPATRLCEYWTHAAENGQASAGEAWDKVQQYC